MNKYLGIIIIVAVLSVVLASLKLAHGQEIANSTIDYFLNQTILGCSTDNIGSNYSKLCDNIMFTLHKSCEENYFSFCFGQAWNNSGWLVNPTHEHNKGKPGYISPEDFEALKKADGMTEFKFDNNATLKHIKPPYTNMSTAKSS